MNKNKELLKLIILLVHQMNKIIYNQNRLKYRILVIKKKINLKMNKFKRNKSKRKKNKLKKMIKINI